MLPMSNDNELAFEFLLRALRLAKWDMLLPTGLEPDDSVNLIVIGTPEQLSRILDELPEFEMEYYENKYKGHDDA
jgi:hypothetical protein